MRADRLRIRHAAPGEEPRWRDVEPVGLVSAGGIGYLLAIRDGMDRTYRLSRVEATERTGQRARRPETTDLREAWRSRVAAYLGSETEVVVTVEVHDCVTEELRRQAAHVRLGDLQRPGWRHGEVVFAGRLQALVCLWGLGPEVRVTAPDWPHD